MQGKQSSDLVKVAVALVDLGLITAAFYLALWLRFDSLAPAGQFVWLYYFSSPLMIIMLLRYGVLTGFRYQRLSGIFKSTIVAFVVTGFISSTVLYLSKTGDYSRLVFGIYFLLAFIFVVIEKIVIKYLFDGYLRKGKMNIRVAVVGYGKKFDEVLADIDRSPQWGIYPALIFDPRTISVDQILSNIRSSIIDEVYLLYPKREEHPGQLYDLLQRLEKLGLPLRVALHFDEIENYYGQHFCNIGTTTGVMLSPYNLDPDQLMIKRAMDLLGGTLGLFLTALLYPLMALLIKSDSPGPVIFSQQRVGKGGRRFKIYKFRSMYLESEQRKHELREANMHQGALFKVENDPRITKVGRIIRKYSLDEFPQFWNVLKGEMSIVGTRPPTIDEVSEYEDHHFRRISIKPGLTGLWQVSGRNKIIDFNEVVALDVNYIRKWNLWLDLKIIFRTVLIVLFPKNENIGM